MRTKHEEWEDRVRRARQAGWAGDIMVLAEDVQAMPSRLETHRKAGQELLAIGQFVFALEQFEKALTLEPDDVGSRRGKGLVLGRLGRFDEARQWLERLCQDHPDDAEAFGLLGRVEKDAWVTVWRKPGHSSEQMRRDAAAEAAQLRAAVDAYVSGFRCDPANYYPGINAAALLHLHEHLTGTKYLAAQRPALEGSVRQAVQGAIQRDRKNYWARATWGDLAVLAGTTAEIQHAYHAAVIVADMNWFHLDSTRQQLQLYRDLGFRPEQVAAALRVFDTALERCQPPEKRGEPNRVVLFSGHMIDAPGRATPRFPADKEPVAAAAVGQALDEFGAAGGDQALSGAACGGDLLFAEAVLRRGLRLQIQLPRPEPEFLDESVNFAGPAWRDRYFQVKAHPLTTTLVMPDRLGEGPLGVSVHERNNLWLLYNALAWGAEKVRFLCLWNRQGGDGPGGTKDIVDRVSRQHGQVRILDTRQLW